MSGPRTLLEYVQLAAEHLAAKGIPSHRLDAELLLAEILGLDRVRLYVQHDRPLTKDEVDQYRTYIVRRAKREPTAYILGRREFYSLPFEVDPHVLIPRPETEILVEKALDALARRFPRESRVDVADVGTGSGAVAVAVAHHDARAHVLATDIDRDALAVAQRNVTRHGLEARITLKQGDLLDPLQGRLFHAILSNPPYVPIAEWEQLAADVRDYEPRRALVGGSDGLTYLRRLIEKAMPLLHPNGFLALEIGSSQGEAVARIAAEAGFRHVQVFPDLAGRDRVLFLAREETV